MVPLIIERFVRRKYYCYSAAALIVYKSARLANATDDKGLRVRLEPLAGGWRTGKGKPKAFYSVYGVLFTALIKGVHIVKREPRIAVIHMNPCTRLRARTEKFF